MSQAEYEPTELEYVQQLVDDFDLRRNDRIGELLDALRDDEDEGDDAGCD